jgi:predicted GTPase
MHLKDQDPFQDDSVYFFIRMIKMLQENGIDVVLVRYPVEKIYYSEARKIIDIKNYYKHLNRLLEENQIHCPVLDYHDLFWGHPGYFRDADHLSNKAAAEFSQVLNDDLLRLGVMP